MKTARFFHEVTVLTEKLLRTIFIFSASRKIGVLVGTKSGIFMIILVILKTTSVIFRKTSMTFRSNLVIFRKCLLLFRTNPLKCRLTQPEV